MFSAINVQQRFVSVDLGESGAKCMLSVPERAEVSKVVLSRFAKRRISLFHMNVPACVQHRRDIRHTSTNINREDIRIVRWRRAQCVGRSVGGPQQEVDLSFVGSCRWQLARKASNRVSIILYGLLDDIRRRYTSE